MVKASGLRSRGCGFEPHAVNWMDVSNAITYTIIMKIEVARMGPFMSPAKNLGGGGLGKF